MKPRSGTAQNQARRSLPQFISCFNPDTEHKPIQGYIILTSIVCTRIDLTALTVFEKFPFSGTHFVKSKLHILHIYIFSLFCRQFIKLNTKALVWPSWNLLGNCIIFVHLHQWKSKIKMQQEQIWLIHKKGQMFIPFVNGVKLLIFWLACLNWNWVYCSWLVTVDCVQLVPKYVSISKYSLWNDHTGRKWGLRWKHFPFF